MTREQSTASVPSTINLAGYEFAFVTTLRPVTDSSGEILLFRPQGQYAKRANVPLHRHGTGAYCRFQIPVPAGMVGVYALVVNGSVRYVGECEDLRKRFNAGYGNISPKNCYQGGPPTNCKVNQYVLGEIQDGQRVDLYFYPTPDRKRVEASLLAASLPPWNGRR